MSREYAEDRIREALAQCRGNATKARQLIIAWSTQDQRLLLSLAQPHLTGIVAHAVSRVIYRQSHLVEEEDVAAGPLALNMAPDTFGKEILSALSSSDTPVFGLEGHTAQPRPKKASQSHIDALKQMASKNKADKK